MSFAEEEELPEATGNSLADDQADGQSSSASAADGAPLGEEEQEKGAGGGGGSGDTAGLGDAVAKAPDGAGADAGGGGASPVNPSGTTTITKTEPDGTTLTKTKDASGVTSSTEVKPDGTTITKTADPSGAHTTTEVKPDGHTVLHTTDASGVKTKTETLADGTTVTRTTDATGKETSTTKLADGTTVTKNSDGTTTVAGGDATKGAGGDGKGGGSKYPWLKDIAQKLSDVTGGAVKVDAILPKLEQAAAEAEKNGHDPRELLACLSAHHADFIRALEDKLDSFGAKSDQVLADIKAQLEQWSKQRKEVTEPPPRKAGLFAAGGPGGVDITELPLDKKYDYLKKVVADLMKGQWDDTDKVPNVIGIRHFREWKTCLPGTYAWNDSIFAAWKEGGKKKVEGFLASVDPALIRTQHPVNPNGCAHLVDGSYTYKRIELGEKKSVFAMPDGDIKFWRDRNRDGQRNEGEAIETARMGLWIIPGSLNVKGDDWSAGSQVIAGGGNGGPWKRFVEILKAAPKDQFTYTLVDSHDLPLAPSDKMYLPLGAGLTRVPLRPCDPSLGARLQALFKHTEKGLYGGFYPFGLSRTWHGGVHLGAPAGQDTVISTAAGEVVAARLGAIDEAGKNKLGSPNFVLMRHEWKKPDAPDTEPAKHWFSLYMHLQQVQGDGGLPWVKKIEEAAAAANAPDPNQQDPSQKGQGGDPAQKGQGGDPSQANPGEKGGGDPPPPADDPQVQNTPIMTQGAAPAAQEKAVPGPVYLWGKASGTGMAAKAPPNWDVDTSGTLKAKVTVKSLKGPESQQVYRWYRAAIGDHFFCLDPAGELAPQGGYGSEGVGFSTLKAPVGDAKPMYRMWNGKEHFYTTDENEMRSLTGRGYNLEGNIGYVFATQQPGTLPVQRYYFPGQRRSPSASTDGAQFTFWQWPTGQKQPYHGGQFGRQVQPVDPNTGVATIFMTGGTGTYDINYYLDQQQLPYVVARCDGESHNLNLTGEARGAGWTQQGNTLIPPGNLLMSGGGVHFYTIHPERESLGGWNSEGVIGYAYPETGAPPVTARLDVKVDGQSKAQIGPLAEGQDSGPAPLDLGPVTPGKHHIDVVPDTDTATTIGVEAMFTVSSQDPSPAKREDLAFETSVDTSKTLKLTLTSNTPVKAHVLIDGTETGILETTADKRSADGDYSPQTGSKKIRLVPEFTGADPSKAADQAGGGAIPPDRWNAYLKIEYTKKADAPPPPPPDPGKGKGPQPPAPPPPDPEAEKRKARAKKAKETLEKARQGQVAIFEPGAVAVDSGQRLAFSDRFGDPKKKMLHFEVFSPAADGSIVAVDDPFGWQLVESRDEAGAVDVKKVLTLIDVDHHFTITAAEVRRAYAKPAVAVRLRSFVVTRPSEWFMDWKAALPKSEFWKKMLLDDELQKAAEAASSFTFWDGGLGDWGIRDKTVITYHPIRFLQWLLANQKAQAEAAAYNFPKGAAWRLPVADYQAKFMGGPAGATAQPAGPNAIAKSPAIPGAVNKG